MLIVCTKGDAIYSVTVLIKGVGMLSNPVEQSLSMFLLLLLFYYFSTSSLFVCFTLNFFVGEFSCNRNFYL